MGGGRPAPDDAGRDRAARPPAEVKRLRQKCARLAERLDTVKARDLRRKAQVDRLREKCARLAERLDIVRARDLRRKAQVDRLRAQIAPSLLTQQLQVADAAVEMLAPRLNPGAVVLARGVESLPAAAAVADLTGARLACDVLEVRDYTQRVAHRTAPLSARVLAEAAQAHLLTRCAHVTTVSPTIAAELRDGLGVAADVMGQWHVGNAYAPDPEIEARLAPFERVVTINCMQNEISPLKAALDGFIAAARSGAARGAVCVVAGRITPPAFHREVEEHLARAGMSDRILLLGQLGDDAYGTVLARTTLGLVTLDPDIGNHLASFPNRVVDFAAFGAPICTPELPDVVREPRLEGHLRIVRAARDPAAWEAAIAAALEAPARLPPLLARPGWEQAFMDGIGGRAQVAIVDNSLRWHGDRIKRQLYAIVRANRPALYLGRNWTVVDGVRRRDVETPFVLETFDTPAELTRRPAWSPWPDEPGAEQSRPLNG